MKSRLNLPVSSEMLKIFSLTIRRGQVQLSTLAEQKLKEAERSRSSVQKQVDRIVESVLFFKDFVSSAVSAEPHAALACAGICIFLPVSDS